MIVRQAVPEDVNGLCELLFPLWERRRVGALHRAKAGAFIQYVVGERCAIIGEREHKIVGTIGLQLSEPWHSAEEVLGSVWFEVDGAHKGGGLVTQLIEAAKLAARIKGVPLVLFLESTERTERKVQMLSKHLTPFGAAFVDRRAA